jgi:phosphate transport system substrate-binding protein
MRNRKVVRSVVLALVAALALTLTGCAMPGCKKAPETETLLIAGSSTMRGYLEPVVKAFAAKNPSVNVVCEGGGSTAGLVALKHGAIDVATVSRVVTPAEDDVYLRDYLVARDGVAIVVNPANPVNDLSIHQLTKMFEGEITTWKAVGGADLPVVIVDREKDSNLRRSFEELVPGLAGDAAPRAAKIIPHADELIAFMKSTPGAIGYMTLKKIGPAVKPLHINGVEMSRMTMLSGRYPLSRSFYLAVHMTGSALAERFIEFTLSKDGQTLLGTNGLLETY